MKRNETANVSPNTVFYQTIARIMKLTIVFLLLAFFQVSAKGWGQDRITLKMNQVEIKKVLFAIEKKSEYRFLFTEESVKGKPRVSVDVKDATLSEVLDRILANTGISYKLLGSSLVVLKEVTALDEINNNNYDVKVTGQVTSSSGEPLAGVSIQVKGSKLGTVTDANGNFSITVPDDAILVISSVGYETQEVAVMGKATLSITLKQSDKIQDAVVVIGYGTANKRDLTGSIVKVSGKEVADKPNTNPVASLQGKVAGLNIVNSGRPGQEPDIRIRGTISLNQTKPLYIVDGIFNDNINFLNPADIESMEVLKDPSSLAIFGVRGANGAIIITTKKGKAGKVTVNFNSSLGFKNITDKPALTDASEFITLYNEQRVNQSEPPYPYYNLFKGNSNWVDLIENKGAIMNINNISLSSGNERNKFYMGLGYIREEGIIKHEKLEKIIITLNDELKVSKAIKIGFNVNGYRAMLPQNFSFSSALNATPIVEPYNSTRNVYNKLPEAMGGPQIANPLMIVEQTKNTAINREYRLLGSVFAELNFLKNFTFRANFLSDFGFNDGRSYTPLINVFAAENNSVDPQGGYTRTSVSQYKNTFTKFQQDYLLTFKKKFGEHNITMLSGLTTYFDDFSAINGTVSQYANRDPIPNDKRWWYLNVFPYGDPATRIANSQQWERATASGLFRILYNYRSKYLLNATFRRDGSSEISPSNRFDNFWSLGAAWEIGKEAFMQNVETINNMKIKASIGKLGNQYTGVHYPYYPNYVNGNSAVFGENIVPAYVLAYRNNPNLKWETVNSYEGGIEFDMFKGKLHSEINYYNRRTNDLLAFVNDGADDFYTNSGSIESKGFELSSSWSATTRSGIQYGLSGNITTIKSKVLSVFRPGYKIINGQSWTVEGFPIGMFYGYIHNGLYQSIADKINSPDASGVEANYGPGDIKFKDINGDGVITEDDRTMIGNPTPDFTYGFSGNISYKGFDVSADFQGVYGNEIWRAWGNGNTFAQFNYRKDRLDRWNGPGTSNWEPRVSDQAAMNQKPSTYMIEDGSYFRLRNLQIGYTFDPNLLRKANIASLRVYLSAQNLKTWKRNSGFTPEAGGSALVFGVDDGGYPIPSIISMGINVNFQ